MTGVVVKRIDMEPGVMYVRGVTVDAMTVRQAVGQEVRRLRDAHGVRQEEVARSARSLGLGWTRSKVAALERGEKAISAEELILLPLIMFVAGCGRPTLRSLLPADGPEWVELGPRTKIRASALGAVVDARDFPTDDLDAAGFTAEFDPAEFDKGIRRAKAELRAAWGDRVRIVEAEKAQSDAAREAEQSAARRLGVPARIVSYASWGTWGRGLTEERDARAGDRAPAGASLRTVQAVRGRVTRELYEELRPALDRYRQAITEGGRGGERQEAP